MRRGREVPVAPRWGFAPPATRPAPRCCSLPWMWLLPVAHAGPWLTLLPRSLEISPCFMAAMRPSIMSEGATMWQPAGTDRTGMLGSTRGFGAAGNSAGRAGEHSQLEPGPVYFWVCPKPESGSSVRAKLGCHCLGLPTCFGISQRHLCQPLAAELVLHGAIFTQDAWETNPGLHRGGTAGASVPRGVWLWGQAQSSSGELHVLGEVDEDQQSSGDGAQHVGAPGKGRQRWGTWRGAQTQVNQLCLPPCGQNPGEVAQAQLHQ